MPRFGLRPASALVVLVAVAALAACSDGSGPPPPAAGVARLDYVSGTEQLGTAGAALVEPLVVRALDAQGAPVRDAEVTFAVTAGGGSMAPAAPRTDASGYARAAWTLGEAGEQRAEARVTGLAAVAFRADAEPVLATTTPGAALDQVAVALYDSVAAGFDVTTLVRRIFNSLAILVVPAAEPDRLRARLAEGRPTVLDLQAQAVARAFTESAAVPRASFVASFAERGLTLADPAAPLTEAGLTERFATLVGAESYESGQLLPAFVLALGRERARRSAQGITDPVWGDELLDPLQFTLLEYAAHYSGGAPGARAMGAPDSTDVVASGGVAANAQLAPLAQVGGNVIERIVEWAREQPLDQAGGWIGDKLEWPTDLIEATPAAVCASILMYGYKASVVAEPAQLFRAPDTPNASAVRLTLTFEDEYDPLVKSVLADFDCIVPAKGSAAGAGKELTWSLTGELPQHGALDLTPERTDLDGRALATYRTSAAPEVPELLRFLRSEAVGRVDVRPTGLVPGYSGLEKGVGVGVWSPVEQGALITVRYYTMPDSLDVDVEASFRVTATGQTFDAAGRGTLRLRRMGNLGAFYEGSGTIIYDSYSYRREPDSGSPCLNVGVAKFPGTMSARLMEDPLHPGTLMFAYNPFTPSEAPREVVHQSGDAESCLNGNMSVNFFATLLIGVPMPPQNWQRVPAGTELRLDDVIPGETGGTTTRHMVYTLRPAASSAPPPGR